MKLSDLPLAEKGVENFKVGQREQHYDSNKAKAYIFVIILMAAIIIISHGQSRALLKIMQNADAVCSVFEG